MLRVTPVTATAFGSAVCTVTEQAAVLPPSTVVTVIVAKPAAMAVTVPLFTVATLVLLEDHVTALFVALAGLTVSIRFAVYPMLKVSVDWSSVTPVTDIGESSEGSLQVVRQKIAKMMVNTLVKRSDFRLFKPNKLGGGGVKVITTHCKFLFVIK
jgi:hypothetical protein